MNSLAVAPVNDRLVAGNRRKL